MRRRIGTLLAGASGYVIAYACAGFWQASAPTFTDEFAMVVTTTTANETFTIPTQNFGTFDADIEWGDGAVSSVTAWNDAQLQHTYATAGDHLIRVRGSFPNIYFNNAGDGLKVKSVENLGDVGWATLYKAFYGCSNMTSFTAGTTDTSAVTNMSQMFQVCSSLTSLDVSSFDTSAVTTMYATFLNCSSLTSLDVSSFDTSAVTNMSAMFQGCTSATDIIGPEAFDIEALNSTTSLNNFMQGVTLPTARYDALLINWDAQDPFNSMSPNFGSSKYNAGGAAEAARANLTTAVGSGGDGWIIMDGGAA